MKTVTFDDEAYGLLRHAKLTPKESFSSVVKRTLGERKPNWDRTFGAWADWSAEDARKFLDESRRDFERGR